MSNELFDIAAGLSYRFQGADGQEREFCNSEKGIINEAWYVRLQGPMIEPRSRNFEQELRDCSFESEPRKSLWGLVQVVDRLIFTYRNDFREEEEPVHAEAVVQEDGYRVQYNTRIGQEENTEGEFTTDIFTEPYVPRHSKTERIKVDERRALDEMRLTHTLYELLGCMSETRAYPSPIKRIGLDVAPATDAEGVVPQNRAFEVSLTTAAGTFIANGAFPSIEDF